MAEAGGNLEIKIRIGAEGKDVVVELNNQLEQTTSKAKAAAGGADQMAGSFGKLPAILTAVASAISLYKLADLAGDAVLAAARFETLGVAMTTVGKNIGYNSEQMDTFAKGVAAMGISMNESRQAVLSMSQANLDLTKATDLARVAQDAAVIANTNSSEAFNRMIYAIVSGQPEMLRTLGINVNFEDSYKKLATQLGISKEALTEQQKVQARMNVVLEAGTTIAGTYESAMGTAGKQINSFTRYVQDFGVEFGKAFGPALTAVVANATAKMKEFTETIKGDSAQGMLAGIASTLLTLTNNLDILAVGLGALVAVYVVFRLETMAVKAALDNLTTSAMKNPYTAVATAIAFVVTTLYTLNEMLSYNHGKFLEHINNMEAAAGKLRTLETDYSKATGAVALFNQRVEEAGDDQSKLSAAVAALKTQFPELVGSFSSLDEAIANVARNYAALTQKTEAQIAATKALLNIDASKALGETTKLIDELESAGKRTVWTFGSTTLTVRTDSAELVKIFGDNTQKIITSLSKWDKVARDTSGNYSEQIKSDAATQRDALIALAEQYLEFADKTKTSTQSLQAVIYALKGLAGAMQDVNKEAKNAGKNELLEAFNQALSKQAALYSQVGKEAESLEQKEAKSLDARVARYDKWVVDLRGKYNEDAAAFEFATAQKGEAEATGNKELIALADRYYNSAKNRYEATAKAFEQAQRLQTAAHQEQAEERTAEAEKAAKEQEAAEKKALQEVVRSYNDKSAAAERMYKSQAISELSYIGTLQQEIDALTNLQAKYAAGSQEYENLAKRKADAQAKIKAAVDATYSRELELQRLAISAMDEGLAKTLAAYDQETAEKQKSLDTKLAAERAYWIESLILVGQWQSAVGLADAAVAASQAAFNATRLAGRKKLYDTEGEYTQQWLDNQIATINELKVADEQKNTLILAAQAKHLNQQTTNMETYISNLKTLLKGDYVSGWEVAFEEVRKKQKSFGELSYDMWKSNIDSMTTYFDTGLYSVIKGKYNDWRDAFDTLLDSMLKAFTKMIAEMLTQWTVSGIADLFKGLSGGTWNFNFSTSGSTGSTLGGIGSLASTGSALYKGGAWLADILGLSSSTPATMSLQGAAETGMLGSDFAAINEGIGYATTTATTTSTAVTEMATNMAAIQSDFVAINQGITAASESSTSILSSIGGLTGGLAIAGGIIAAGTTIYGQMQENEMKSTPAYARYETGLTTEYFARVNDSDSYKRSISKGGTGASWGGGSERTQMLDEITYMERIAERAGISEEAIQGLIVGVDTLKERMAAAAAEGNDTLVASLQAQIDATQAAADAYGFSTEGLGEYGYTLQQVAEAMAPVTDAIYTSAVKLSDWIASTQSGAYSAQDFSNYIMELGSSFNLSSEQASDFAAKLLDGSMTVDQFRTEMESLATSFFEAGGATDSATASVQALTDSIGTAVDGAGSMTSSTLALATATNDLTTATTTYTDSIGKTTDGNSELTQATGEAAGSVSSLAESIAGLQDKTVTVTYQTVYTTTGDPGGGISGALAAPALYHTGGLVTMHTGGLLSAALAQGMITAHGGTYLGALPGFTSDEVLVKALRREFVLNVASTDHYGADFLNRLNRREVPVLSMGDLWGASSQPVSNSGGNSGGSTTSTSPLNINISVDVKGATSYDSRLGDQISEAVEQKLVDTLTQMDFRGQQVGVRHTRGRGVG